MEFPVSWDLNQLGLEENLSEEIRAAEILEQHGYRACVVGDLASVVYGSDVVVGDVYIAVADGALQSALKTLLEHGFSEEPQTDLRFRTTSPTKDSISGWPGCRLRRPSPRRDTVGVLLIPSSLWHLDLDGSSFSSDTLLFPQSMCRFPRIKPYLNALIHTIVERVPNDCLNQNLTHYIQYQYATILSLFPAYRRDELPIENQFFIRFYYKILLPRSRIKFFSLWRSIRDGSLSVSDAIASLPRRDMRIAKMKAKKAEVAGTAVDTLGSASQSVKRRDSHQSISDCSSQSNGDYSSQSNSDYSLQSNSDYSLQSNGDCSPQSNDDCSPQPNGNCSLEPNGDCSPQPNGDCSPQPNGNCSSQPNDNYSPQPNDNCSPQPNGNCNPQPNDNYSPQPNDNCSPQPNGDCSPQPNDNYSPQPNDNCSPQPNGDCSPQPNGNCSPQPNGDCSPQPNGNCSPQPNDNYSPQPTDNCSPQPNGNCNPQPNDNYSPQPNDNCSPQPNGDCNPQPTVTAVLSQTVTANCSLRLNGGAVHNQTVAAF